MCVTSKDCSASLLLLAALRTGRSHIEIKGGVGQNYVAGLHKKYPKLFCAVVGQEITPQAYDRVLQEHDGCQQLRLSGREFSRLTAEARTVLFAPRPVLCALVNLTGQSRVTLSLL